MISLRSPVGTVSMAISGRQIRPFRGWVRVRVIFHRSIIAREERIDTPTQ